MARRDERIKMARPGEPEAVRTTIVGGQPPRVGRSIGDVPRGVEVLVKKAAVDPAFKKVLLEKRAGAAENIALTLSAAEAAMLNAAPVKHIEAIVANTKVNPGLRPAFLGYAAAAMLAALAARAPEAGAGDVVYKSYGIIPDIPPETAGTAETKAAAEYGWISGLVYDENGKPLGGALVEVEKSKSQAIADKDGYYQIRIEVVSGGVYSITASYGDYGPETQTNIKVIPGIRTNVSFVLFSGEYEYVPSKYPLITGIMPDHPAEKGE